MRTGSGGRVALLVALLSASIISPLAPVSAQESPGEIAYLCFEGSDGAGVPIPEAPCRIGAQATPNFLEGDTIRMHVNAPEGSTPFVRVQCIQDCRDAAGREYFARWRGDTLRFPQDFTDPGPDFSGRNAVADRAPRFNGTWEAAVVENGDILNRRTFNVWLMTLYESANLTVSPGETHLIRASGFDSRGSVHMLLERRVSTGVYVPVREINGSAASDGVFRDTWSIPKSEALRMSECGTRTEDCYRLRVSGEGKSNETITLRVSPATLLVKPLQTTPTDPLTGIPTYVQIQRTQNALLVFGINYPSGAYAEGPKLLPDDIPASGANPERGLRVYIERVNRTNPDREPIPLNETRMVFVPERFAWVLNWTVPRDLPLDEDVTGPQSDIRMRLANTRDAYGNRIEGRVLANFTVIPATLAPVVVEAPEYVGRTELARFAFEVRYHNGSVWGPAENATGLRGCFVRDRTPAPLTCRSDEVIWAKHENGTWVVSKRFARDYEFVQDQGLHRVLLLAGFEDPWGNKVTARQGDPLRALITDTFTLLTGSPHIDFTTTARGVAAHTLERGDRVSIQAVIKYADGSPFNHTFMPNESRTMNVTLTKRGVSGAIQSETPLVLRQTSAYEGRWIGDLQLTRDDTETPAGTWTFLFDVRDNLTIPNANLTRFDRDIAAALIHVSPDYQPPSSAPTGSVVRFRFKLYFDDGRVVPTGTIGDRLEAQVHPYDAVNGRLAGDAVSGFIVPQPVPGSDGEFVVEWQIPYKLFAGEYAFIVRGGDTFGNRIRDNSISRSFTTFSETREREVLVQPPPTVKRGESATVVFDGRDADVGGPGIGVPALRLERWDQTNGRWVIERQTTRISDPSTTDHIGIFPVTTNTVIGLYRFRLEGRDETFNKIHAISDNFTVEPTVVQRALVEAPPIEVVKGEPVQFGIERLEGDRFTAVQVLLDGRPTELQQPLLTAEGDHVNVTFQVPYEARVGNYSIRLVGRDLYGNGIDVRSPQVSVTPASLLGKIIGNPTRVVDRGEPASILFGITNPDGGFYLSPTEPRVEVHDGDGPIAEATVRREGLTFSATWTPGERTEESEYVFVVSGTGAGGNAFPTLRSEPFRVAPGIVERVGGDISLENVRMNTITYTVPMQPDDQFVTFRLGYYGPSYDVAPALFETRDPTTVTPLPHTIDIEGGRYAARFVTDYTTAPGAYRIFMEGEDARGNDISSTSDVFLLKPTAIIAQFDAAPPDSTFGPGLTYEHSFIARYQSGTTMTDQHGRPSVALLYDDGSQGRKPIAPRPEISYRNERWYITWTAPDEPLPDGTFTLTVGGTDAAGNTIASTSANSIVIRSETGESVGLFLKEIPGPSPVLLLLALLGIAVAFGRRK